MTEQNNFLTDQIITYMGNKRKLLYAIENALSTIQTELNTTQLSIGDGFSGSGIVSRLFKTKASTLYTNDLAGYSQTLNECYLATPSEKQQTQIKQYIDTINNLDFNNVNEPWISKHWAPINTTITKNDRVYFTHENGKRIDIMRDYIQNNIPNEYQHFVLAPLLVETSIHNNTNGQFSAYYKDETDIGAYGGKNGVDIKRITKEIHIPYPIFCENKCKINISRNDVNEWVKKIPKLDVVYFDPPYNKHPYNIYYFLLDIVNEWDKTQEIPSTYRGQPKNWEQSKYNSSIHAKNAMKDLIANTNAKYIMVSYNNGGIIPIHELDELLIQFGNLHKIPIEHKTYNRLKGISNYKREKEYTDVKEFLYVLKKKE